MLYESPIFAHDAWVLRSSLAKHIVQRLSSKRVHQIEIRVRGAGEAMSCDTGPLLTCILSMHRALCTHRPMYQTLLFDFSGVWFRD